MSAGSMARGKGKNSGKPALLIVDDEKSVATTWKMILELAGYDVACAYSCAQALQYLGDGHRTDAVITDLNMEEDDIGLEVARYALQLKDRPVVMILTGYATAENAQKALELRVDYLGTKPIERAELISALQRLLSFRAADKQARS